MRKRPGWAAVGALLAFLVALPASAEWVDWIAEANVGVRYDSNLNDAGFGSEAESDFIWRPDGRLGRVFQLGEYTRISAVAEVQGDVHNRWNKLDAVVGDGRLSVFHKFGLGDAPWARAYAAGGYEGVQDGERSGGLLEAGSQIGKRFSPRFDASLAYQFTSHWGEDGRGVVPGIRSNVWNQQYHEVIVDGHFLLTEALLLSAGFGFQHGDLYSNSIGKRLLELAKANVEAVAWDNAFGGWAFRLKGNAYSPYLSLNYAIGDHWSIDASYRFRYSKSDSLDFTNQIGQLTVLFRY